jgi:hypothetical protein
VIMMRVIVVVVAVMVQIGVLMPGMIMPVRHAALFLAAHRHHPAPLSDFVI